MITGEPKVDVRGRKILDAATAKVEAEVVAVTKDDDKKEAEEERAETAKSEAGVLSLEIA